MKLAAGHRLGTYRIEKFLTSGGMGDVYLAAHEQLDRHVAIKILSDAIAGDPVAVQRFRREARAASTLGHPHICTLFDFCQQDGLSFLVLEYLDGVTLEARLRKGHLTFAETARIGAEVAEALDHAHSRGFVHRDLKPANVMLTRDQGAKVLDFGLVARSPARFAAAAGTRPAGGTASTAELTIEGMLVGTVAYMAPEQIQGGEVDARTDIYALGALLYEMLTGRPAYEGRSPLELAVSIVHGEPIPLGEREPATPELMVRLVERCMARNPEARWQSARDVAAELRWLAASRRPHPGTHAARRLPARRAAWIGGGAAALLAVGLITGALVGRALDTAAEKGFRLARFGVGAPPGVTMTESSRSIPALSPDGSRLLFVGTDADGETRLYVHDVDHNNDSAVPMTEGAMLPFWAPDGRSIGYFAYEQLTVISPDGLPVPLASVSLESRGASWSRDDVVIYSPGPRTGVFAIPVNGITPRELTVPDSARGEIGHLWPRFLPDGRHFVYFVSSDVDSTRGVYIASLDAPAGRRLVHSTSGAAFGSGHLLYMDGDALLARPFDAERMQFAGAPRMLDAEVLTTHTYAAGFSVSETGDLAYWEAASKDVTRLIWLDRSGQRLDSVGVPTHQRDLALSPDGRFVANVQYDEGDGDIFITDLQTGRPRRLASPSTQERNPVWSPDGRSVVFVAEHSSGWAIYRWELDAARGRELLLHSDTDLMITDWSPDGSTLVYANRQASGDYDLYTLRLDPGARPLPLARAAPVRLRLVERPSSDTHEVSGRFSPSGRWIAYGSTESGRLEIYLQPYPVTGLRCQISGGGGYDPHWGSTDAEIFYLTPAGALTAVALRATDRCPADSPRQLFQTPISTPGAARNHYAVSATTGTFLFNAPASDPKTWAISVFLGWPSALPRPGQ